MKDKYEILGTTDEVTSCSLCGKAPLKLTYIIENTENGEIQYLGCC